MNAIYVYGLMQLSKVLSRLISPSYCTDQSEIEALKCRDLRKHGNDQSDDKSYSADQRLHDRPGLECCLLVETDQGLDEPESGIVKV